jgi:hypothetical protein
MLVIMAHLRSPGKLMRSGHATQRGRKTITAKHWKPVPQAGKPQRLGAAASAFHEFGVYERGAKSSCPDSLLSARAFERLGH